MVYTIRTLPDDCLRKVAEPLERITDEVRKLSADMVETMYAARGVGLAANQIGVSLRLITIDISSETEGHPLIVVNPEIVEAQSEVSAEEGCLSVPGFYEMVKRAERVIVRAQSLEGEDLTIECAGLLARVFQHEIDHLNGVLFVDHLSPVKKGLFKKEYLRDRR